MDTIYLFGVVRGGLFHGCDPSVVALYSSCAIPSDFTAIWKRLKGFKKCNKAHPKSLH